MLELIKAGHRDAAGHAHLRGPARAHRPPRASCRACSPRGGWPRSSRRSASSARASLDPLAGAGRVRPHRRLRRADADARDRHAVRHPRSRPGGDPRQASTTTLRTEAGKPMDVGDEPSFGGEMFAEYIDWRVEHPSDDLMTELLHTEFEDETGTTRTLTRDEALLYIDGRRRRGQRDDHAPDRVGGQGARRAPRPTARARRRPVADPERDRGAAALRAARPADRSLRARATSRCTARRCRRAARCCSLVGAANHDDRRFEDPRPLRHPPRDRPAPRRSATASTSASAPRSRGSKGRIALDELLARFPEWDVDLDRARIASTSTVRGFETLPVSVS